MPSPGQNLRLPGWPADPDAARGLRMQAPSAWPGLPGAPGGGMGAFGLSGAGRPAQNRTLAPPEEAKVPGLSRTADRP